MSDQQQTLTIQQALDLAVQHHTAGRLSQAEKIYQQILQSAPNQPVALHLLGVIAHQVGKNDTAVDLITKALAIKPHLAEAHNNLGIVLQTLEKPQEAIASYQKALNLKPDYADPHYNLGVTLQKLGKLEEAVARFQKALDCQPDLAEAHGNLGLVLRELGKPQEAIASCQKALTIKPDYAEAHFNLGIALFELGHINDAMASLQKAAAIKPDYAQAHNSLGNFCLYVGEVEKAAIYYEKAIEIDAQYATAHSNLGLAFRYLNKREKAEDCFRKALTIDPNFADAMANYAILLTDLGRNQEALGFFHKKTEFLRGENPANPNLDSFRFITEVKIKHDIEQFQYLENLYPDTDQFTKLVRSYSELKQEIQWPDKDTASVPLSEEHRKRFGSSYNRPLHIVETREIPGSALNKDLDARSITQNYIGNAPGMTYFDNLLNPEALHALRRFLMESTIWYAFKYPGGYLGTFLADGLACPLLLQIADQLRQTFPDIFKRFPLNQLWAFKYDSRPTGITIHADAAAINVNFWVTPDTANLNPKNGGLIVYKEEAPMDWDFKIYNTASERIREFLVERNSGKMVVPYAENRVVLFNSDLFHETDSLEFKPGYENRRINITMLFGNRWN